MFRLIIIIKCQAMFFSIRFLYVENLARLALVLLLVAKQQATSLSSKSLDMLLHAQHIMPPYGDICDVLIVQALVL